MATNNQKKPSAFQGKVNSVLGGFTATPGPDFTSLKVQGQDQENTAIVADLQAIAERIGSVAIARAAYALAVADRKDSSVADEAYVAGVVASLKVQLYGDQAALNTFGIGPNKPHTLASSKTRVAAAAKAEATRTARGTMSKKARLMITAVPEPLVSVTGVTPAPAPAAPTAGTAPAASASPVPAGTAGH